MEKSGINTVSHYLQLVQLVLVLAGLTACSHTQTAGRGNDQQQRIRLGVGDIREISLPRSADTTQVLTGGSDNAEVVDVSPKPESATQPSPAPSTSTGPLIFLIKGVTVGTARVVFTEKRAGTVGDGQPRKAYLVQVVSK